MEQAGLKEGEDFPFVILGNKCDLETERKVPADKAKVWAKNHGGLKTFEISAKDSTGVEEAFVEIAKQAASHQKEDDV